MEEISALEFSKRLSEGRIHPLVLLFGSDDFLKDELIDEAKRAISPKPRNYKKINFKEVKTVVPDLRIPDMFSEDRVVAIEISERTRDEDWTPLAEYSEKADENTYVLMKAGPSIPAKASSLKNLLAVNCVTDENSVRKFITEKAVREGLELDENAFDAIAEYAAGNILMAFREMEKISAYKHGSKKPVSLDDISEIMGFEKGADPYAISTAVRTRDGKLLAELADRMMNGGVEPLVILYRINSELRKILKYKIYAESGKQAPMSRGEAHYISRHAGNFSTKKLKNLIIQAMRAEAELKSSPADASVLVKQIIYSLSKAK